jgi:hypothetical protein
MIFVDTVSLEGLRGGSAEVFSAAPAAVRCKLMIFVHAVSIEALRGGSAEVFSAAPAAVRCKLDTRLDTFQQLLQDNQFRNRFFKLASFFDSLPLKEILLHLQISA